MIYYRTRVSLSVAAIAVALPACLSALFLVLAAGCPAYAGPGAYVRNEGDVIVIRHADGSIETREAKPSGPTYYSDDGTPVPNPVKRARVGTGKRKGPVRTHLVRKPSAKRSGVSRHSDVVVTRNADGSIETRDAH